MAMKKLKRRMLRGNLLKEFPYAKPALSHVRVMKEHDGIFSELRVPEREVVLDVIVELAAVDMEQVDRPVDEIAERIIDGRTDQAREGRVLFLVPRGNGPEHALVVEPRVLVTFPCIDGVGVRAEPQPVDGLAKGEIGIAVVRAELDEAAREQRFADPEGKGRVLDPRRWADVVGHPK